MDTQDTVIMADLRMGMTPNYTFRFAVAKLTADQPADIAAEQLAGTRQSAGDIEWLLAGVLGDKISRPAEEEFALKVAVTTEVAVAPETTIPTAPCG